jgi:outer membrane protein assembly factor BamB
MIPGERSEIMETRRSLVRGLLLLVFALGSMSCAMPADDGDGWLSLGGDYQRTGRSGRVGPAPATIRWTFPTGGAVVGSVTVGPVGRIHIACEDGKLYTLDSGGKAVWTFDANSPLLTAPSVGPDGGLYVGARDGRLLAVDPNGLLRWTFATGQGLVPTGSPAAMVSTVI